MPSPMRVLIAAARRQGLMPEIWDEVEAACDAEEAAAAKAAGKPAAAPKPPKPAPAAPGTVAPPGGSSDAPAEQPTTPTPPAA